MIVRQRWINYQKLVDISIMSSLMMLIGGCLISLGLAASFCLLFWWLFLIAAGISRTISELGALAHLRLRRPVQLCNRIVQNVLLSLRLNCFLRHAHLSLVSAAEVAVRNTWLLHHLELATRFLVSYAFHEWLWAAEGSSGLCLVSEAAKLASEVDRLVLGWNGLLLARFAVEFQFNTTSNAILGVLPRIILSEPTHRIDQRLVVPRVPWITTRRLARSQVLGQCLRRIEVAAVHLLRDLGRLLVDAEVAGGHVHVSHGHEGAAHVDADRGRFVCVVVVVVAVAHFADVCRGASAWLQILNALNIFTWIRRLLFMLRLMACICFIATRSRQFALRRVSILVNIDARIHLFCLFWGNCSPLTSSCTRSCHLVSFALPRAFYSVALRILNLRNLVTLSGRSISKSVTDSKLLLEVLLCLLGN